MTCIVGVRQNGRIWLGGDSLGSDGWCVTGRADAKVFQVGPFLLGYTDSFRMGQLLRYSFTPPPITTELYRYLCTIWVDAVRDCFKAGGFARKDSEAEAGGEFLVGVGGRLFHIAADYQVGEALASYNAVGSGYLVALGALAALAHLPPAARCRHALQAAALHTSGVRGPFVVQSLRNS